MNSIGYTKALRCASLALVGALIGCVGAGDPATDDGENLGESMLAVTAATDDLPWRRSPAP